METRSALVAAELVSFASLQGEAREILGDELFGKIKRRGPYRLDERETFQRLPLIEHFHAALGVTFGTDGNRAANMIAGKYSSKRAPKRSLVGTVVDPRTKENYDLAVQRDKCVEGGFSIFLCVGLKKIGYVLCRVEDNELVFRGAHVCDAMRGKGLTRLLFAVFLRISQKCEFRKLRTDHIDKPLLGVALLSAGFRPDFLHEPKTFRILVAPDPRHGPGASLVFPSMNPPSDVVSDDDENDALSWKHHRHVRSTFSNKLCRTQRITVAPPGQRPPSDAKVALVKTRYHRPTPEDLTFPCDDGTSHLLDITFCSARLLALLGPLAALKL